MTHSVAAETAREGPNSAQQLSVTIVIPAYGAADQLRQLPGKPGRVLSTWLFRDCCRRRHAG